MHRHLPNILMLLLCLGSAKADGNGSDPYIWLEDVTGQRAMAWVQAENAKTRAVLESDPAYAGSYADALAVSQAKDRIPAPQFLNGRIFNFWQDETHVRGVLRAANLTDYRTATPHWTTVLDLDAFAKAEGANWVYKGMLCAQPAEDRCMVSVSNGGEDAVTVREFDIVRGRFVETGFALPHGKQRLAWVDQDTLLVAREWKSGQLTTSGYPFVVKLLKRGQSLADATEIFRGTSEDGGYGVMPRNLTDGAGHRALLIERPLSTFESEHFLVTPDGAKRLALPAKAEIEALVSNRLIVALNQDWHPAGGPSIAQGTLVAIALDRATADPNHLKPEPIYVPGPRDTLQEAFATQSDLIVATTENVKGRVFIYRLGRDGAWHQKRLALADDVSIDSVDANLHGDDFFVGVSGFLTPSTLLLADTKGSKSTTVKRLSPKFDTTRDVVEQFEATSTDGTKVPYFVVHPKTMALDGTNPTIINAYGGFQVSETPSYSDALGKLWLEKSGVFVLANIRGGGEFGPAWHEAGLKTHRQRIYDDFASVARDLISRKITSPRRLGIEGGSNGGLLMGVEFTQHPELWNAVDIRVPLLDMLRFEKIAAGASWVGEYGSVSVPAERDFLASISPYNNLHKGRRYPEPLIWTTTKDDRVGPQHARKFAARLAEYGIPYFFYEVTEGGHGAGANLQEKAHTSALEFTYFARKLMD